MPSGIRNPNLRVTTGFLDNVSDDFPGGGSASPGFSPGQLGARVTLGSGFPTDAVGVKFSSTFKTPLTTIPKGTFQYVQSLSGDSTSPAQGLLAFWSDRANYIVSTLDTNAQDVAGVYLGALGKGKFGFIQAREDGGVGYVKVGAAVTAVVQHFAYPASDGTATAQDVAAPSGTQASNALGVYLSAKDVATSLALVQFKGQMS